jgi:hypothetical protein
MLTDISPETKSWHLVVNECKSAVASVFGRKFLVYSLWVARGSEVKRKVVEKPLKTFKQRIRELTCRFGGRSMTDVVQRLRSYMLGWKGYFQLGANPQGLAKTRRMAASQATGYSAQALEAWKHSASGIAQTRCCAIRGKSLSRTTVATGGAIATGW